MCFKQLCFFSHELLLTHNYNNLTYERKTTKIRVNNTSIFLAHTIHVLIS